MRWTPINITVGPVTRGGKILRRTGGGRKESKISTRAHTHAVPRIAPYPSGHGNFVPSAAVGHVPFLYSCARAP
jgi:hypothetical protein